jgi:dTDP-4-amino-4,6-dideoxygalactose transaminase
VTVTRDRPIPFLDLQAQHRALRSELDAAVRGVMDRCQFVLGPETAALEAELAAVCGVLGAVGVASGTDALELALRALAIGPGDEVVTTPFSFIATAEAIVAVGATPVFADIDAGSFLISTAAVEAACTPRTKALIPVHLFGRPCDMDAIMALARTRRLAVVEDCAQAIGATWRGQPVGAFGDAGALSFYPTKNLGGCGDGGMVVTRRPEVAEQVRLLRHHGDRSRYDHAIIGRNSRIDELQAAILRVKARRLAEWTSARRERARRYRAQLEGRGLGHLAPALESVEAGHVHHAFTIRVPARDGVPQRDRVRDALSAAGIGTAVYYPRILPEQPALRAIVRGGPWPHAQRAAAEVLSLPLFPELPLEDVDAVVGVLAGVLTSA